MLLSHRAVHVPDLGAALETRALVHTSYRLHVVSNRGVVCEDALVQRAFERKGAVGRPVLTVVLEGRARVRFADETPRWLEPGDFALFPSKGAISMRQEGEAFRSVALEWDPGTLGARPSALAVGRLDAHGLARIGALADGLAVDGSEPVARVALHFATMLDALRAEGFALEAPAPGALIESVSPTTARLSHTLDRLLSHLDGRPMAVDLDGALGLSARQVTRVVTAFNTRYGFNAEGWRDTVNRRRLSVGAALMSAPAATTEGTSATLGYSSPTAFCRAMAEAGLPAPGAVADAVAKLR